MDGRCGAMKQTLEESKKAYANGYYKDMLENGLEFQDFVTDSLYKHGWVVVGYSSRKYQIEKGENILGVEIKHDMNWQKTGNLYIETAEKARPENPHYVSSGIHRDDNSLFFLIGDYEKFWVFQKQVLKWIEKKGLCRRVATPTSRGFLVPIEEADRRCILFIEPKERGNAV